LGASPAANADHEALAASGMSGTGGISGIGGIEGAAELEPPDV
jgi:hypothetical protein